MLIHQRFVLSLIVIGASFLRAANAMAAINPSETLLLDD